MSQITVLDGATRFLMILGLADESGLPPLQSISIFSSDCYGIVPTVADVGAWAEWAGGVVICEAATQPPGVVFHIATAEMFDLEFRVLSVSSDLPLWERLRITKPAAGVSQ